MTGDPAATHPAIHVPREGKGTGGSEFDAARSLREQESYVTRRVVDCRKVIGRCWPTS